jgi:hypothetical protein
MVRDLKGQVRKPRLKTLLRADAEQLFGEPDIKKILSHWVSRGLTATQIAGKYGSTVVSVRDWLRKLGLTPKSTRPDITERLHRLGYVSWDEFFRRNMSMTHVDAAKMLDAHWTSVAHYRRLWVEGRQV